MVLKKHEQTLTITTLLIINFVFKGVFLSSNSLGGDEPFSVYHAQMDITSIINLLSEGNNPPLYEILLHYWIKIFGISEFSVRFPSLLFSTITVLFIYKLGVKYLNKRVAIYASIIFIFSNYQVFFAHEARVYSLLGMLSIISMYFFMGILKDCSTHLQKENKLILKKANRNKIIAFIIVNTLIIYAHYFGFFILITQILFLAFNKKLILKYWKQVLVISSIILLLYVPNIAILLNRFVDSSSSGTWVTPPNGIDGIYNMLRQFSNAPVVTVCVIIVLLSSFIKFTLNYKNEQLNTFNKIIVFWFVFIFFFMFGVSYLVPMFLDRYLMPASIAFIILLGISADYIIKTKKYKYMVPVIISILFISTAKPNFTNKRNVEETVEKINEIKDSNSLVLISPSNFVLNFIYYYDIEAFKDYNVDAIYSNINSFLKSEGIHGIYNLNEVDYKKYNHIIFLNATPNPSYNDINKTLDEGYHLENKYKFYEIFNVYEYNLKQ
ncbi:MAG: glycosyltransferase family 39 protein [Brumimicrobium sp.]